MTPAVPKLSSLSPRDRAMLDHRGLPASDTEHRCVFCGAPCTDSHHEPPRSRLPKREQHRLPRFAACGFGNTRGCHGLLHHNGGALTILEPFGREWFAVADARAAAHINTRRKRPIAPGVAFPIGFERSEG